MTKAPGTTDLHNQEVSAKFYEGRYEQGYMDEWPSEKKAKVIEVIRSLNLPLHGDVLDFGCGNGVLSEIVRQALPGWNVFGTDLSSTAVSNARLRYPKCAFFEAGASDFAEKRFDMIFTNHVIEHVFDLDKVFDLMVGYLKPRAAMLHFLPCGNEGSYEYEVCRLRTDGINPDIGNRFFFEDVGHVRRLKTEDLNVICATKGFDLIEEFYSNQHYGAIEWITGCNPIFALRFSDPSQAINRRARSQLNRLRLYLLLIAALRLPVQVVNKVLGKEDKVYWHYLALLLAAPFYLFSMPIDRYWKRKAKREWNTEKRNRSGSEMILYYQRIPA